MKKSLLLCFIIGLSAISLETPSYAFSINISPPSARLSVAPGETQSGTITVENKSDSAIDMRTYTEDWIYEADGGKKFLPAGTTPLSCAKWINVSPQKFHLEAGGRLGVKYSISVPEDAVGGHYAVIFFESITSDAEATGNILVRFAGRIGTIVYQETVGMTTKTGSIVSFECGRPDQNKPLEIKVTLKNEGNAHIIAQGVLNVIDKEGNIFGRKLIGPINTFPGDTMEYKTEWLGDLEEGVYDVIATLDTGIDIPIVAETSITVKSEGEIEKITAEASAKRVAFDTVVYNTGNLNARVGGRIDILDGAGEVVESIPLKETLVAPDSKKGIKTELEKALQPGEYRAKAVVLFGDKKLIGEEAFSVK